MAAGLRWTGRTSICRTRWRKRRRRSIAEALAEEAGLTVSDVTMEQKGDLLALRIALLYEGKERSVSVEIGGE